MTLPTLSHNLVTRNGIVDGTGRSKDKVSESGEIYVVLSEHSK